MVMSLRPSLVPYFYKVYFHPTIDSCTVTEYPGTTSFRPPKKYFVLFNLLSSPVVLVIALYYLSVQEQQI